MDGASVKHEHAWRIGADATVFCDTADYDTNPFHMMPNAEAGRILNAHAGLVAPGDPTALWCPDCGIIRKEKVN